MSEKNSLDIYPSNTLRVKKEDFEYFCNKFNVFKESYLPPPPITRRAIVTGANSQVSPALRKKVSMQ